MATATIISYPQALVLAGNILPVRIAAGGSFTFELRKGSDVLLSESYVPDASGQAEIDIRSVVLSDLSLQLPSADVQIQENATASYTIVTDSDSKTFKAVLGGVDHPATDAETFLKANFLTWQPQIKQVLYDMPEWLSFYISEAAVLKARFYKKDGTAAVVTVADFDTSKVGNVYTVNVQFARLWGLATGDRYGIVDVWIENATGTALSYTQRYVLDATGDEHVIFVACNSVGGIDTYMFRGDMQMEAKAEHTNVVRSGALLSGVIDASRTYTVETGILSVYERKWVRDLLLSRQAWVLMEGSLREIVLLAPSLEASSYEDSSSAVDFRLSEDDGFLNIPRSDTLPEDISISGPEGEVFFLAPRLIDYPDAVLSETLIMPVQSPFEEKWNKMSVGALALHLMTFVDEKYESSIHIHDNLQILSLFSLDEYGRLLWNNEALGSGDGSGHTDHAGELIRPAVIAVPRQPPGADFTLLPGECYMYFDVVSAVDGETPTASGTGGLDVDELWPELGGSSDNKVISSEHLPEDVVYDADLDNYYSKSDSDSRYVTLATEQVITGKKTFNNDVVFGGNGSKMFVPSTAGTGLYYMYFDVASAVNGETPTASGGLDVDELWAELGGSSSNKVIAQSHIPDIYVKKAGGTMTGQLTVNYDGGLVFLRGTTNPLLKLESGSYFGYVQLSAGGTLSMDFGHSTGKGVYLTQSGNVGIGTTSPAYKLDIDGDLKVRGNIYLRQLGGMWITGKTQAPIMTYGESSVSGNTYHPIIWGKTTNGDVWNLGHGANDQVGFFGYYSERTANGTDWQVYIRVSTGLFYASSGITTAGDVIAYSSSSKKLKELVPHKSYSDKLRSLGRIVDFRYNDILKRDKLVHTGLIYENVESVLPAMCHHSEGYGALNYLCKDYINLIAGAVQEHADRLDSLYRKVKSLSREIKALRRNMS